jgi:hypothetical protein
VLPSAQSAPSAVRARVCLQSAHGLLSALSVTRTAEAQKRTARVYSGPWVPESAETITRTGCPGMTGTVSLSPSSRRQDPCPWTFFRKSGKWTNLQCNVGHLAKASLFQAIHNQLGDWEHQRKLARTAVPGILVCLIASIMTVADIFVVRCRALGRCTGRQPNRRGVSCHVPFRSQIWTRTACRKLSCSTETFRYRTRASPGDAQDACTFLHARSAACERHWDGKQRETLKET